MVKRQLKINDSNNKENPNQNVCAMMVAKRIGVADHSRYLHTIQDLVKASRKFFTVRSRLSSLKVKSVGGSRKHCKAIGARLYIAHVKGHVLLLNNEGKTIVDTAPRKIDKRKLISFYAIF